MEVLIKRRQIWEAGHLFYLLFLYHFLIGALEHGHRWDSRWCDFSTGFENGYWWCYSSVTTVGHGFIEVGQRERAQGAVDPEKLPERKLWKACQDIGEEGNWKLISRMGFADIPRWKDVSRMDKWQDNIVSLYFQDGRTIRIKILEVSTPLHYCSNLFPLG